LDQSFQAPPYRGSQLLPFAPSRTVPGAPSVGSWAFLPHMGIVSHGIVLEGRHVWALTSAWIRNRPSSLHYFDHIAWMNSFTGVTSPWVIKLKSLSLINSNLSMETIRKWVDRIGQPRMLVHFQAQRLQCLILFLASISM
jgi:hypothetical protein